MKLILMDNIKKLGSKYSIIDVADGLALGKLIPEKKAVQATAANLSQYRDKIANQGKPKINQKEQIYQSQILAFLNNNELIFSLSADAHGSLYQAVKPVHLCSLLRTILPADAAKLLKDSDIVIKTTIKKTGTYSISLFGRDFEIIIKAKTE
jgi:ribosomal protein L9